MKMGYLSCEIT